jgi:ATP-binding cassette, subfamily B, bacterial PglK
MHLVTEIGRMFNRRDKLQLIGLIGLTLGGSVLEVVGIGVILPFVALAGNPSQIHNFPFGSQLVNLLNLESDTSIVVTAGIIVLSVFVLRSAYVAAQYRLVYRFSLGKWVAIASQILQSYLDRPYTFHLQKNTAELIRNIYVEADQAVNGVIVPIMIVVAELLVLIGVIVLFLVIEPGIAFAAVIGMSLAAGIMMRLSKQRLNTYGKQRAAETINVYQAINESLAGIKDIQILGRSDYFIHRYNSSAGRLAEAHIGAALFQLYPRLGIETLFVGGFITLVTALILTGQNLVDILPLISLLGVAALRFLPSLNRIVSWVNAIRFSAPSLFIISQELRESTINSTRSYKPGQSVPRLQDAIKIRNLSFKYPDEERSILTGINLTISRGEKVGIVGASGAGKTTLVNLILGLIPPSAGEILVDDVDIYVNLPSWQRQIGYIPQDIFLTDSSIRTNVAFGLKDELIDDGKVWQALTAAHLTDFVRSLPQNIETVVGERGVRLSGGQRQRLGIARALYHDPAVLILDEATSSLDHHTEEEVMEAIDSLAGQKTIVVISHRPKTVENCHSINLIESGCIVSSSRKIKAVSASA